jgi:hypothetical protein
VKCGGATPPKFDQKLAAQLESVNKTTSSYFTDILSLANFVLIDSKAKLTQSWCRHYRVDLSPNIPDICIPTILDIFGLP